MILNEWLEKILTATLWMWLPFRACGRLLKELREKYF